MVQRFAQELSRFWGTRKKESRKGDNGRALIIGGSREYAGCLSLAGVAALRTGCDWVTIAAPEKAAWAINALSPDLVTVKLKGDNLTEKHEKELQKLISAHDVFLMGNGMDLGSDRLIRSIVEKKAGKRKVLDARALRCVRLQDVENAVLTPHRGEFDALLRNSGMRTGQDALTKAALNSIQQRMTVRTVILLKGSIDLIIAKDKTAYNEGGNPGMTKAGTGDVLAGLVLGFLAQGMGQFKAAQIASWLNKQLGENLNTGRGYAYIASDLLRELQEYQQKGLRK